MFANYDKKVREEFLKSLPDQLYVVQLADPPYTVKKGLATPRLIEAGETEGWKEGNVWRMRDESYDPPGTKYTRVRVFRHPDR